jgi:hypothetical protein
MPYITALQKHLTYRVDVIINYLFHHSFHPLQIVYLRPAFYKALADLIDCILNWPILRKVWQMTNNMGPAFPHGLIHLWHLMKSEIVMNDSPLKSQIGYCIVYVEYMLNKRTIGHCGRAMLYSNTCPNMGVTHRANNTCKNCQNSSFH